MNRAVASLLRLISLFLVTQTQPFGTRRSKVVAARTFQGTIYAIIYEGKCI